MALVRDQSRGKGLNKPLFFPTWAQSTVPFASPIAIENLLFASCKWNYNWHEGHTVKAKETLRSIRDHFFILLTLIGSDLLLKALLHFQHILAQDDADLLQQILSYFLIGIVLVFAIFGFIQLTLHAFKGTADTVSELFPKKRTEQLEVEEIEVPSLDGDSK